MNYEELPEKKKKSGFWKGVVTGAIVMAVAAVVVTGVGNVIRNGGLKAAAYGKILDSTTESKINSLAQYIQSAYYEDVDDEELQEGLYKGLFENLDEYSQYYTADEYENLLEQSLTGTYCGIGASLQQDEKTKVITIVHVYDGSPAQKAGLKAGDIILKADEYEATEMDLSEFVTHIRGEEGTKVHIEIERQEENEKLEFDITRENLVFPTVSSEMLEDKTGYIDVTEFTENTPEQFSDALSELEKSGMKALIVDLRSNPGGVLTSVCDMLDEILPKGLLVYTEDRNGKRQEYESTDEKSLDIPLAILVDSNSASASEIFAGAIQDRKAGTIIGTTTYGKGVVQTVRSLEDGSAFKITTNRYFTPGGTCIQGIGIKPDIELEYKFLGEKDDEYSYELDNQIQKAIEVLKKAQ